MWACRKVGTSWGRKFESSPVIAKKLIKNCNFKKFIIYSNGDEIIFGKKR